MEALEAPRLRLSETTDLGDFVVTTLPATCATPSYNVTPWLWAIALSLLIALALTLFLWAWDQHKLTQRFKRMQHQLKEEEQLGVKPDEDWPVMRYGEERLDTER